MENTIIQQKLAELRDTEKNAQAQLYLWKETLDNVINQINVLVAVITESSRQEKEIQIKKAEQDRIEKEKEEQKKRAGDN